MWVTQIYLPFNDSSYCYLQHPTLSCFTESQHGHLQTKFVREDKYFAIQLLSIIPPHSVCGANGSQPWVGASLRTGQDIRLGMIFTRYRCVLRFDVKLQAVFALNSSFLVTLHQCVDSSFAFPTLPSILLTGRRRLRVRLLQLLFELPVNIQLTLDELVLQFKSFFVASVPEEISHPASELFFQLLEHDSKYYFDYITLVFDYNK